MHKKRAEINPLFAIFYIIFLYVSWLNTFVDNKLLKPVNMYVGSTSSRFGIAFFDSLQNQEMFIRHVFGSSEVIVVDVSESENKFM